MSALNDLLGGELFDFVRKHLSLILFLIIFVVVPLIRNLLKGGKNAPNETESVPTESEWERVPDRTQNEKLEPSPEQARPTYFPKKSRENFDPEETIRPQRKAQNSQEKIELALASRNAPRHSPREGSQTQKSTLSSTSNPSPRSETHPDTASRIKKALSGKDMREVMIAGEIIQPRYF